MASFDIKRHAMTNRPFYSKPKCEPISLEGFGDHLFRGAVAAHYLKAHGLDENTLDNGAWTTDSRAEQVRIPVSAIHDYQSNLSFLGIRSLQLYWIGPRIMVLWPIAIGSSLWLLVVSVMVRAVR
jgi:hypothetical protein